MATAAAQFAWGPEGAAALVARTGCTHLAVVDVCSFSTTVSLATGRGATVVPAEPARAAELAASLGATLAGPGRQPTAESPWTLSPSSILGGEPVARLVLGSPNGAAITAAATRAGPVVVVAACVRNRGAVAAFLQAEAAAAPVRLGVVAAGERWPNGALRPALEDLVGAGALLHLLACSGWALGPAAGLAARSVAGLEPGDLGALVEASDSAAELIERGYPTDVALAAAVDVDDHAPVLTASDEGYRAVA